MCANVFVTLFAVFALPSLVLGIGFSYSAIYTRLIYILFYYSRIPAGDVVCYIDGEAQFLPTGGMYGFSNIPSNVCDIIVFRGNVYPSLNGPTQLDDEFGFAAFAATNSIPLLIAITDPSPSSSAYSDTVSNSAKRTTFVQSIVNMVSLYNLAGIEIDWQTIEVSDTVRKLYIHLIVSILINGITGQSRPLSDTIADSSSCWKTHQLGCFQR